MKPVNERLERLRKSYIEKLPETISQIKEIWTKLRDNDWSSDRLAELHLKIHSLAGSGSIFGLKMLSSEAKEFDKLLKILTDRSGPPTDPEWKEMSSHLENIIRFSDNPSIQGREEVNISPAVHEPEMDSGPVMIFEADEYQLRNLSSQIAYFGYTVRSFVRLEDLTEAISLEKPRAVIIDISILSGNMIEVVNGIRKMHEAPIPLIFISNDDNLLARLRAVKSGATAYFTKPLDADAIVDTLNSITMIRTPEPYRVLVIDDEPEGAEYYSVILQHADFVTMVVTDPMQVLKHLNDFNPDVILMDLYMPGCSGIELAKVIRQMEAYVCTPIIFLSMEQNIDNQLKAMRQGGDDFLTKPVTADHLISSVTIRAEKSRILNSYMTADSLTGLLNHSKMKEQLEIELSRASRLGSNLSFAMVDLDNFKSVNDTHGHLAGDRVLKTLARLFQRRLRKTDIIGRYGGEEFAIIFVNTGMDAASRILYNLLIDFGHIKHHIAAADFSVTFSCGIASYPDFNEGKLILKAADSALYRAKDLGRNRIVLISRDGKYSAYNP